MVDKRTPHVYVEFEAKFGELWWTREQFTFMWNLRQNLESSGHQEKYKSHTSVGRKFAPVEGLSHDLVCTGSIYHVHFAWQVWHGQLSPRFKFNKLKSFSGVEIDQNHVDKRILGGKGFAVGRLKRHNFCPASALRNRCCIDTKRCSGGYTQPQGVAFALTLRETMVDKRTPHVYVEFEAIWRALVDKRTIHVYVEFEAKFGELWAPRKIQKSHCVTEQVLH